MFLIFTQKTPIAALIDEHGKFETAKKGTQTMAYSTRTWLAPLAMVGLTVVAGCGKKSSSSPSTTATTDSTDPTGSGSTTPKIVTTTNALAIYTSVSTTAASTGAAQGFSGGLALDDGPVSGDGDTAHCTRHGEPVSADASRNTSGPDSGSTVKFMSSTDIDYVAGKTYCVITHDTADPDSLRGALSQMQLFACMIGNNAVFDGTAHDLDLTTPDLIACFSGQKPADLGVTTATLTAANPPAFGDSSWDFSTEFVITISGTPVDMKLLWKSSDSQSGFASLMPPVGTPDTTGKSKDAFMVIVDTAANRMTLDSASQRLYSQGFARRFRVTAGGAFDSDGKFTKINDVSFVESQVYSAGQSGNSAPANPLAIGGASVVTASGNTTVGFLTENYNCGDASVAAACEAEHPTKWKAVAGVDGKVFDGDGSGTGVTAIKLTAKADLGAVLFPSYSSYVAPETWFATAPVPTWTTATLAAVQAN